MSKHSVEPYEYGMLDVSDGNSIFWECCGNPDGIPVLVLHGGPGSGCTPGMRRYVGSQAFRGVLFDQRGCGRSRPLVSRRDDLQTNATHNLVDDIERLREHLRIDRWLLLGFSWGTTLALAYAQIHPRRASALVLASVTTTSRGEVDWITTGVGRLFPEQWERFAAHVPAHLKDRRIVDAYAELLFDDDPGVCAAAAAEWCAWEDAHVSLSPGHTPDRRFEDPEFRLRFARLVTHYWRNAAFLQEEQLLRNAGALAGIPGTLIHGRYDVSSPLEIAWRLHKKWPGSVLHVADSGHGDGSMAQLVTRSLKYGTVRL